MRKSRPQTPKGGCESSSGYEAIDTGSTPVGATTHIGKLNQTTYLSPNDSIKLFHIFQSLREFLLHIFLILDTVRHWESVITVSICYFRPMAGAFTNRHTNLKKILEGYETLVQAALACGVSANYLSQLKGGKHIGHVTARRLEQGLNLEEGWLDLDHAKLSSQPMNEQQLTVFALKLSNKARIRLLKRLVASLTD